MQAKGSGTGVEAIQSLTVVESQWQDSENAVARQ